MLAQLGKGRRWGERLTAHIIGLPLHYSAARYTLAGGGRPCESSRRRFSPGSFAGSGSQTKRAERGVVDANLGGGLIKQRVARAGQGRSGGYRTIIVWRARQRCIFVHGAKNRKADLSPDELVDYREFAALLLGRYQRVSSMSWRMVSGGRMTSCSMTRAAMRVTPLVLRRLCRKANSSR